ncbi:integrase, partial [Calderihabitans maritimus]
MASPVFGVKVQYNDTVFDTLPFVKPKKVQKTESTPKKEKKTYRPPDTHYYK